MINYCKIKTGIKTLKICVEFNLNRNSCGVNLKLNLYFENLLGNLLTLSILTFPIVVCLNVSTFTFVITFVTHEKQSTYI